MNHLPLESMNSIRPVSTAAGALAALLGISSIPAHAAIDLDLSYVDMQGASYARFKEYVDRAVAGNPYYGFSAVDAAYMYRLTGQASYCTLAVETVDAQVSAAEQRIAAGQRPAVAGDSYLYVGEMISEVAFTYDWCSAYTSGQQRSRWTAYADQAVWNVWNFQDAYWGSTALPWSGWSVDNPGNNYHFSFITATLLWAMAKNQSMGEAIFANGFDPAQAAAAPTTTPSDTNWMRFLQQEKAPALHAYYATLGGGGSREGTNYGIAQRRLFGWYGEWYAASGQDLGNATSHMTDTIRYWLHATLPNLRQFAPIGDQVLDAGHDIYDYQRHIVLEAAARTDDAAARAEGMWWLQNSILSGTSSAQNRMTQAFNRRADLLPSNGTPTLPTALMYRSAGAGHLFSRTAWNADAMWTMFVAGTFDESHAAQDQGSFSLFAGNWLAVTSNIYSNSGIVQATPANNVLRFERGGEVIRQTFGRSAGFTLNSSGANGSFDATATLTPMYDGNIGGWLRNVNFANRKLTVRDTFTLSADTRAVFQLHTPVQPVVSGRTAVAGNLRVSVLAPSDATLSVVDMRTQTIDGYGFEGGWRIDVRGAAPGSGAFEVELGDQ